LDPKLNQIVNVKVTVNFVEVPNSAIFYTAPIPSPNVRFENVIYCEYSRMCYIHFMKPNDQVYIYQYKYIDQTSSASFCPT